MWIETGIIKCFIHSKPICLINTPLRSCPGPYWEGARDCYLPFLFGCNFLYLLNNLT